MSWKLEDKLLNLAKVFSLIDNKSINLKQGSKLLNYSYWHFTRLYKKYRKSGLKNLFVRERKRRRRKLREEDVELLKNYYLQLGKPQISLLLYFLRLDHHCFPEISSEWVRKILIKENVYSPSDRRKVFRKRFEAPYPGTLVQGDSTMKRWIPGEEKYYHLISFIDDCTRICLDGKIVERDTIENHFEILKGIVKRYGKFVSLYYDNDEKCSYIRHGNSRFFEYKKEEADLQVVRALSELGIEVINSRPFDPHGKGKIERFIGTLTMQLPVWFRRYKVKTLEEANKVLKRYIDYYNREKIHREIGSTPYERFLSLSGESKFSRVERGVDLDRIFSYRYERVVSKDNTIRFNGKVYQLERRASIYSYGGKKAEIRYFPGKPLKIYIDGESVRYKKILSKGKEEIKYKEEGYEKVAIL